MGITIGGIELSVGEFAPDCGEAYALFFDTPSAIGAVQSVYSLLAELGFGGEDIVAEHFYFQRDFGKGRLMDSLQSVVLRGLDERSAVVVIPGLSASLHGLADADEADVLAHLFELRRQLSGSGKAPCFVPFHSRRAGNVPCESVKRAAEVVGFIVCDVEGGCDSDGGLGASDDAAMRMVGKSLVEQADEIIRKSCGKGGEQW